MARYQNVEVELAHERRHSDSKFTHEEECLQLQQQLEKQSKQSNEALQETEEQLLRLHQRRDHHSYEYQSFEKQTGEKMKAVGQKSRDDAQTQLQQHSEAREVLWNIPQSDVQIVSEIEVGAWGVMAKGVYRGQPVAVKLLNLNILNSHNLEHLEKKHN